MTANSSRLPTSLLIDLPNWVGDTMMALPAVSRLVAANREGSTLINVRPSMARLLEALFPGCNVITTEKKTLPFRTALQLRHRRFEVGITFRNAYRAKILLFLSAEQRLGSTGQGARFLLSRSFTTDRSRHQVFDPEPMLKALGLATINLNGRLEIPESLIAEGRRTIRHKGLGQRPIIGLAPASASAEAKRWPAENFAMLADALNQRGYEPVILIGPGEESLALEILRASEHDLAILGRDLDVAGLASICTQMAAVVGIDSGPMHVASMAGTGVVALFGPTDAARTSPTGTVDQVLSLGLECSPCEESVCPYAHNDCMRLLSVETVETAILKAVEVLEVNPPRMRSGAGA